MSELEGILEAIYREHSARLLAVLVRIFGPSNLALAEDVLHEAFGKALESFRAQGMPENPTGWIIASAKNRAIDVIRAQRTQRKFAADLTQHLESDWTLPYTVEQEFSETKIQDDQLRMIFMCACAELTPENRIPLILRSLCGFSIPAVCRALLLPEGTVKKRLLRSREKLAGHAFAFPAAELLPQAMDSVHTVIYLLFNEGFHSSDANAPINVELCREALHLAQLLVAAPRVSNRDTLGLLALMNFHLARVATRLDREGHAIPLDLQDRARWDASGIALASELLALAPSVPAGASGRFYLEARIAAEHCKAESFETTNWPAIVELYDGLIALTESPLARLNQAVAIGYAGNLEHAIQLTQELASQPLLRASHLPCAVLSHLYAKRGDGALAHRYLAESIRLGGLPHEQRLLRAQVERLLAQAAAV